MMDAVIIIGAGGHGRVVADIVLASGKQVLGFLDDVATGAQFDNIPIVGKISDYLKWQHTADFIVGIGNGDLRRKLMDTLPVRWYTAIHPSAVIGHCVTIGKGSVLMPNTVVNCGTKIGEGCIINTSATIDHDNQIGAYSHISVGAHTAGTVRMGECCWLGIGACVSNDLSICPRAVIGAGGVVVRDITEPGTYAGVPVRRIDK